MELKIPYLNTTLLYGESGTARQLLAGMLLTSWGCHFVMSILAS